MKKSANTRATILQQAFELIYQKGYQSTSIDEIIATTKVTKGAFYYHFKNKNEMGFALIKEVIQPKTIDISISFLSSSVNPSNALYKMIENLLLNNSTLTIEYGCPLGNLVQEMSPINNDFKKILEEVKNLWLKAITTFIKNGQDNNTIANHFNAEEVTEFIISSYWGVRNLGKLDTTNKTYTNYLKQLKFYLKGIENN
ncbi:TetR/AcrR family transcriptional regulator [Tenacibaculum sp.]|uniref:TetR/AcrR family transcriptional regulator n=1 Tax=Tenacibaculum sp. TaxID=1906242 RepID=UPI003D0BEBA2